MNQDLTGREHCKIVLFTSAALFFLFLPILVYCTDSVGNAAAMNGDIIGYVESFKKIYYGILTGNKEYALNFSSIGYGGGTFVVLLPIVVLVQFLSGSDLTLLLVLRLFPVIFLVLSLICADRIICCLISAREKELRGVWLAFAIIMLLYPSTIMLVTRIHPEMMQFFFSCIGTYSIIRYEDSKKLAWLILSGAFWGIAVGTKISGVIMLVIPYSLLLLKKGQLADKLKRFLSFSVAGAFIGGFFLSPASLLNGDITFSEFRDELAYFSQTLSNFSISDFDNYVPLSGRADVIKAWIFYAFSHGYMQLPGIVIMACVMAVIVFKQAKDRDDSRLARFNVGVLLCFILNCGFYIIAVTRVSVYYYFAPTCLLTIAFLINCNLWFKKRSRYIFAAVIAVCLLPSAVHTFNLYIEQKEAEDRTAYVAYRYNSFKEWLCSRRYPYYSILLPMSMPMDLTSTELNWIPDAGMLSADQRGKIGTESGYLESWGYYWTFDDIWNANSQSVIDSDVFAVAKMDGDYSNADSKMKESGKQVIYEDNYVIAYGNISVSVVDPSINTRIDSVERELEPVILNPVWNGTTIFLTQPTDCSGYDEIDWSFDLTNAEDVSEIRLVFNGSRMDRIENAWHCIVRTELRDGRNSFALGYKDFVLSTGYIDWSNVTNIGIGGVGGEDAVLSNISISFK